MTSLALFASLVLQQGSASEPPPDVPGRRTLTPWPGPSASPASGPLTLPIEGAPPTGAAIAALADGGTLAAYAQAVESWVSQNHGDFRSTFEKSPLVDLAVQDPVAYNVYTYLLDQAQRRADREILMALLALLTSDDPAVKDYLATYAKQLAAALTPGTLPGEVMANDLAGLDHSAVYQDRFGPGAGTGLVESAASVAGVPQELVDLIHDIAGHADLDPATGKVTVELAPEGLREYLAKKVESYRGFLNTYATSLQAPAPWPPTLPDADRIPPEAIPTQSEFWSVAALSPSERLVAVHDLSRAFAYHATEVAALRVRGAIEDLRAAAGTPPGGRTDAVFALLLSHLERQRNELGGWRTSAGGLTQRVAAALARSRQALADRTALLAAARAQRDQVETASRDGAPLGSLPKPPDELVYDTPPTGATVPPPPSWGTPGTGFDGAGQGQPTLPLDQDAQDFGGAATTDNDDPIANSQGLLVECHWDSAQQRYVCTITIPGVGVIQVSP